jgi:NAD(P)H-nitrite reductase large subunit
MKKLKAKNTEIYLNYRVVKIDGERVFIESKEGTETLDGIDDIVVATGMKPYIPFEYKGSAPVFYVGDVEKVAKAQNAIQNAYKLATGL